MGPADQLTVARMAAAPIIVALYAIDFAGHDYWATALFAREIWAS
jgi:phosphatidylglycerophosphate synthase